MSVTDAVEQIRQEHPELADEEIRDCAAWLLELAEVERTD